MAEIIKAMVGYGFNVINTEDRQAAIRGSDVVIYHMSLKDIAEKYGSIKVSDAKPKVFVMPKKMAMR